MKTTIKDIARMAGVSVSTVSKIINNYHDVSENTKRKVLEIMERTGYRPTYSARSLAMQKSNIIGVIYAGKLNADFNQPFFVDVMNDFKKAIGLMGYDLLFFSNEKFHFHDEDYLARCRHFSVDGCIIISGEQLESSVFKIAASEIPTVAVDIPLNGQNTGYIMTDNNKMAKRVVQHLTQLGHKEIAHLGAGAHAQISIMRGDAFKQAMQEAGLHMRPEWHVYEKKYNEEDGYRRMHQWLASEDYPRAIFATSDLLAIGAMRAVHEHGLRVPEDIAIIGCDDIASASHVTPKLTTIRQDKEKIGKYAAYMLMDIINGQAEGGMMLMEPELIIRGTCGASHSSG